MADMDPVFSCFVFYGALLVVKMYIIAIITGQVRLRKKVSDPRQVVLFAAVRSRNLSHSLVCVCACVCSPKGVRQPGGLAETRRSAVPQRGSLRREVSEVKARSAGSLLQLVASLSCHSGAQRRRRRKKTLRTGVMQSSRVVI